MSMFPWLPLTMTDRHVIQSTNRWADVVLLSTEVLCVHCSVCFLWMRRPSCVVSQASKWVHATESVTSHNVTVLQPWLAAEICPRKYIWQCYSLATYLHLLHQARVVSLQWRDSILPQCVPEVVTDQPLVSVTSVWPPHHFRGGTADAEMEVPPFGSCWEPRAVWNQP